MSEIENDRGSKVMKFKNKVFLKYQVIAGDVVDLMKMPKFKKRLEKTERQQHNKEVLEDMRLGKQQQLKKTGSDDNVEPPKQMFKKIDFDSEPKIKASTMSVLMADKNGKLSSMGVFLGIRNKGGAEETANLTLRFDQEKWATLCGYPGDWSVWDEQTDPYDSESMTMEEWLDNTDEFPESIVAYISRKTEKEIFRQLKASLENQFKDPKWEKYLTRKLRTQALQMIEKAIARI